MRKHRKRNWFVRRLVLGLAVMVVAVPVAQARVDGSTGWSGPRQGEKFVQGVNDFPSTAPRHGEKFVQGETDFPSTIAKQVAPRSWPGVNPGALPKGYEGAPIQVVSSSDGFDWGDAGIGAGTVFAVMLLAAGGMLASRRTGHQATV